ncbi:hypothetical protein N7448_006136 [Penicillium atrosanguineum]|uniref:uncharacterized protein n=1 Tax=Penicillium atrosanguineum TaxID=1132637 RepID=UPI0023890CFD|nr:uncharacterized protein N7443_009897 [Penicillium atrosanguineum]KAJ5131978.1 hypothetical protein N7448_006136 [Penicillium atrosanguineum]KAJ5289644.1 hypothetical protein N7443_009897 [Penicillium atrosanguineum]
MYIFEEEIQRGATAEPEMAAAAEQSVALCASNSRISITTYCTVLDIFRNRLYDIWPIVDVEHMKAQLRARDNDPTTYALAAALCAATLAQIRLWLTPAPCPDNLSVTAEDFAKECLRIRLETYHHQEASLQALVTSIFLHMYYANRDQITPATISLREAITYADLMHLCHTSPSDSTRSKQWQMELRCYWILFVTERTFCIQHDLPITLNRTPNLPEIERNTSQGDLYAGFCALVQLFLHVQRPLVLPASSGKAIEASEMYSKTNISDIQRRIQVDRPRLDLTSEIQFIDILTTSAWVRSLLWQYSASRFMLSSSTSIEPLSFDYPLAIAKDYLESLSQVSIESMRSHGYGMEIKLLQIANSVLDVVLCMPKFLNHQTCHIGPLDAVITIEHLLSQVGGVKSDRLSVLHQRLSQMPSSITMPLMLEYPEEEMLCESTTEPQC